ncbi:diguanylate cyclase [Sporobacter termitidis DSM 10068]|uniref:Diguanylate cyclase n=1 Tax=Sporobacter termitidis DSM 10068 TaxID=1123282 RepID=A0A1M5YXV4_9FIRM|nr:diguanylate cyclase [Sporobacter termitidis]SHI16861.1 diguanylate cyclase [Sporobacter termitidis DSM 10068]
MPENTLISEIEAEYRRIDAKWLKLHFKTSVVLVLTAFFMECLFGVAIYNTGDVRLGFLFYAAKYILAPLSINAVLIALGWWATRSPRLTHTARIYIVSLCPVVLCFIFYSVHSIFYSLYLAFTLPVVLTVVYGNYLLTAVTAVASLAARIISGLFVRWDPDVTHDYGDVFILSDFLASVVILCVFFAVCLVVIYFEKAKNSAGIQKEIERRQLRLKTLTDELTGVGNRTALRTAFESMEKDKSDNPYIFVMIDLDNFKLLNDTWGHDAGDRCLRAFGAILAADVDGAGAFRFGGDEFCILFKSKPLDGVLAICRKIQADYRKGTEELSQNLPLTASFGIALRAPGMTTAQLLKNTDTALYRSKIMKDMIYIYDELSDANLV